VAVGRAIVRHPKVFLFDEPLSNLDAKLRVQMRTEISKLHKRLGATIIYVTHDQTEAMTMGDKIVVMKDGIVQQVDSPLNLYNCPENKFVAGFIGSPPMNFINGKITNQKGLSFLSSDKTIAMKLPSQYERSLQSYANSEITLGLRPEDILIEEKDESPTYKHSTPIDVAEQMGNETYLYFKLSGSQFTARVKAIEKPKSGALIDLFFNLSKLHFFSKEENAIM